MVSRIFGFARDMLLARVLGAGLAADAFQLAFTLPNTFRRLFAEGAFSVAFVPTYSRALHGTDAEGGGEAAAAKFADDVLSVFLWILLVFSAVMMIAMPGIVWLLARDFQEVPGKFEFAVFLSRVTFPYLALVSLVAMLSGLLNARSRFAPGAFAPVLLNIVLIGGIITGWWLRGPGGDDRIVAEALCVAVSIAGVVQLAYMWWAVRRAGLKLHWHLPRLTPEVKKLGMLILPATFGAGIYQISQFVDTFFATSLAQGSLTLLKLADRLNQLPLGIVGIALGTAILPMLSRHIHSGDAAEAQRLQGNAFEIATLLTLPAAAALAICAPAFVTAFFVGGRFTEADGAIMAQIVAALVAGLPAYVIVKILNPGFFAREDMRTPVWTALAALIVNIAINLYVVEHYGIVGLAGATAASASLNCLLLYTVLHRRGWFHFTAKLGGRIARQLIAVAAMSALLWWMMPMMAPYYGGGVFERIWSLVALCTAGGAVFFVVAFLVGALDKDLVAMLTRRRAKPAVEQE
ncbi:murein biosynthesis protein MurJ [Sphingopyxis sp. H038]|nr:murein biosynthesis protein MurJ [Sphingopyxis sp. H012]KTE09425.1 murein biosynthesis protein MurJ [Sphingopyxis sp. H053]KTE14946.1 murein biosynthesis protein MurJ [Sphingopyxis sp. H093]KTE29292.1 murein biosynthesis protein MurJ [Sphingopyxis sp. H080]KTE35290.1 murein biosynthesis protein MurJ [Sphingopyxis sp. H038]KTE44156.1 murein biosynthesis protein MurJ [Sphingopyxis sp. H005]KTE47986.1 murein biosynthesis protein MurJ [Sphingopyxis sp. H077]KTE69316.1 murein biosynthesis prot